MRMVISALQKCWLLFKAQNLKEGSDFETDEGPLRKHRRLNWNHWTAVSSVVNMDRIRREGEALRSRDGLKSNLLTRDVGILCSDLVPVNDKCVMVGTTGIAALKAKYGDDFTNFEIIQDIGYSSESSTHLSGDDGVGVGGDRYFNIRVYNYNTNKTPSKSFSSLKEELENSNCGKLENLGSSLGSSSAGTSFNDSGFGTTDLAVGDTVDTSLSMHQFADPSEECVGLGEEELYGLEDESDYLEAVLETCMDFGPEGGEEECSKLEASDELHFTLSGIESDDAADNFHNRSSFTTSAQVFYKMISVDSDNGELCLHTGDTGNIDDKNVQKFDSSTELECQTELPCLQKTTTNASSSAEGFSVSRKERKFSSSDSEQETYKLPLYTNSPGEWWKISSRPKKILSSTPIRHLPDILEPNTSYKQGLKRKRDRDTTVIASSWKSSGRMTNRVRSWLNRCSNSIPSDSTFQRKSLFRDGHSSGDDCNQGPRQVHVGEDLSSCDASCEYTSSSADEATSFSSSSYFFEEDSFQQKGRLDSYSMEGSFETVIREQCAHLMTDSETAQTSQLPPSPPATTTCSTSCGCCKRSFRKYHAKRKFHLKTSSEGDLRTHATCKTGSFHRFNSGPRNILSVDSKKKDKRYNPLPDMKSHLSSSLPDVLRRHSHSSDDDFKVSSDYRNEMKTKCCDPYCHHGIPGSRNQSSSSDVGKRRRRRSRKKSSSSNRSSRSVLHSGDSVRHRSRTLTGGTTTIVSLCGSRRRHFSQRSDFFGDSEANVRSEHEIRLSDEKISAAEDVDCKDLNIELEDRNIKRRDSSSLLSPVESDVVLTQLEEQSTVSDQVWDGYQDMPYLSEAYSETTVDEDAIRKLIEFGDDYGSAIGQPMRLLDVADGNNNKTEISKLPSKKTSKTLSLPPSQRQSSLSNDSDSDSEDLHHVIEETAKALQFARGTLKRRQSGDFLSSAEYAELLATCGTHLRCLQTICERIEIDGKESNFPSCDLKRLHDLIEEWDILQKSTIMYEKSQDHVQEKYVKAKENIDALFHMMSELSSDIDSETKNFNSWEDVQKDISKLQMALMTLQETKEKLRIVNLQVHRFMTEYGNSRSYKDRSLKDDVTELYRQWEDIYEQNGNQLTELENFSKKWKEYNEKYKNLRCKLEEAEMNSVEKNCDKTCLIIEEESSLNLQKGLKELQYDAIFLKSVLKDGPLWKTVEKDLRVLEERIEKEAHKIPASRSVDHPNSSVSVEDGADDHFEDALQSESYETCDDATDFKMAADHLPDSSMEDVNVTSSRPSRFWRVIRVAVPVHFALVLLYCIAWYLEPNCCDMLNNFNFSLTPQFRYIHGPPPV
ncbi:uncharacterized protein LOC118181803 isoform X2 [Stegodyphus dumicola]|uniref:uncharacterized protein LOC118181803 isoform X2 n=1 Tax=Stegodyphus dumicola TaxID=202533 RepID=UPI0015AFA366|nr:uncharacterized protein LOC118181803 isoform X2 [Stegodyphus dumicola]